MTKISVVILLFAIILFSGCNSSADDVFFTAVDNDSALSASSAVISTRGVVESIDSRSIYSSQVFTVEHIYVKAGDYVEAGQLLARLDTADFELRLAAQKASLEATRQSTQRTLDEARRMLNEAVANLSNNTNIQILNAQAELTAALTTLEAAQISYDDAMRDYNTGTDTQIINAESLMRSAKLELEKSESEYENITVLHNAGIVSADELRQANNALIIAQNQYNDTLINYENAREAQQRHLEQLRRSLQAAVTSSDNARELYNASLIAAQQDIENLRGNLLTAEASTNLEAMEISLRLMEHQLEETVITSPINGVVTNVFAEVGMPGSGLLFIVEDIDNLKITTSFREYDIGMPETGMEVILISPSNAEYKGVISRINPSASLSSPVVEFEAEILVTSEDTDLRIGMNIRIDIV